MESKYDRVAYPENVYLHSDGETDDFGGTGVYPVSVISRKQFRDDTIKIACIKVRRKSSTLLIIGGIIIVLLIIALAIGISAAAHRSNGKQEAHEKEDPNQKDYGLFIQPVTQETGSTIHFSPAEHDTYIKYLNMLDFHTHVYSAIPQTGTNYIDCANKTAEEGQQCQFDTSNFGSLCLHSMNYGYNQGRPCVLLTLKLPSGMIPEPFDADSEFAVNHSVNGVWSPDHIPVTCNGDTAEDRSHIGSQIFHGPKNSLEDPIYISPKAGFPVNFYKGHNTMIPGVMVGFNTIKITSKPVTIKCTVWAKNFNKGKPETSPYYTTKFKFLLS